jgi:hypothetical protein
LNQPYPGLKRKIISLSAHLGAAYQGHEQCHALVGRLYPRRVGAVFHFGKSPVILELPLAAGFWCKILDSEEECWYAAISSAPPTIRSEGEVSLTLPPRAIILFTAAPPE